MNPQSNSPKTDAQRYALDKTRRWPVKGHRGISFRLNRDLERTYLLYESGSFVVCGSRLDDAKARQEEVNKAKRKGQKAPINPAKIPTFGELAESWYATKAARKRPNTLKIYRAGLDLVLIPRFGKWRVTAIDADAVAKLIRDLEREGLHAIDSDRKPRPLGRSSILNYLKPLQGTIALAIRDCLYTGENPLRILTADERPKQGEEKTMHRWSDEDVRALLDAAKAHAEKPESKHDYSLLLQLTVQLGLRLGEVLGLQWQDMEDGKLHVRRQWTKAGEYASLKTTSSTRSLKLPADLKEALIAFRLRSDFSQEQHPIFSSSEGTPVGYRNVTARGFEPARDLAGLPSSLTFHDLRHACASKLIGAKMPVTAVAAFLGHADPTVTLRVYAHLFNSEQADEEMAEALAL